MAGATFDDPNRESVGLEPIWSGAPDDGPEATGATAGIPGAFTPAGAVAPWDIYELTRQGVTASPATAWTTGQHVLMGNGQMATWSGTAWTGGPAPLADGQNLDELPENPSAYTIATIEEWVEAHPDYAADVLTAERARGDSARTTLLDWLEAFDGTAAP